MDCKYIFINTPSMLELEKRLKGRGTETQEKIKVRLSNAAKEIEFGLAPGNFDKVIVNSDLQQSFVELVRTLQDWFPDLDLYLGK